MEQRRVLENRIATLIDLTKMADQKSQLLLAWSLGLTQVVDRADVNQADWTKGYFGLIVVSLLSCGFGLWPRLSKHNGLGYLKEATVDKLLEESSPDQATGAVNRTMAENIRTLAGICERKFWTVRVSTGCCLLATLMWIWAWY